MKNWRCARALVVALVFVVSQSLFADGGTRPIIFAHGIGVPAVLYERIVPLRRVFRSLGYDLLVARTPIAGRLETRAEILRDEIKRLVPDGGAFHLLGHSMGGLDARLAVSRYPEIASRCLSVTTLATPHHGSSVADFLVEHAEELGQSSSLARKILELLGDDYEAARQLTTAFMNSEFNSRVSDLPNVRYFSMGFYIPEPVERHSLVPLLWMAYSIMMDAGGGRNDGFVSVESAQWGRSIGVYPADHWSETAPIPFFGGATYREVAAHVAENLHAEFDADSALVPLPELEQDPESVDGSVSGAATGAGPGPLAGNR